MTEQRTPARLPRFIPTCYQLRSRRHSGDPIWWWERDDGMRSGEYATREAAIGAVLEGVAVFARPEAWRAQYDYTEAPPDAARARVSPAYTVRSISRTTDDELAATVRRARALIDIGGDRLFDALRDVLDTVDAWEASRER